MSLGPANENTFKQYQTIVSNFVSQQFPAFYRDSDTNIILFMEAYYEWMEHETAQGSLPADTQYGNGPVYESRELFEYRDIDLTLERFLEHFQKKYLYGIPFSIITSKRFLLKHVLDVYRSKTNIACYRLLFKLIYGDDVRVYLPGRDMLRVSDGIWHIPRYIEVNDKAINGSYIGKTIRGLASGTTAVVEAYIREELVDNHSNLLYISNVFPKGADFTIGEAVLLYNDDVTDSTILANAPIVLGSLDHLEVTAGGQDFRLGYQFQIADRQRYQYYQKFGTINFDIVYGGFGFTANATSYTYNHPADVTGYGAHFEVSDINNNTSVEYNTDLIVDRTIANGPLSIDAAQYDFPASPTSNLQSQIGPVLSYATQIFGTIDEISNTYSGRAYTNSVTTFSRSTFTSNVLPGNIHYSSTNTALWSAQIALPGQNFDNTDIVTVVNINPTASNAALQIETDGQGRIVGFTVLDHGLNFNYDNPYIVFSNSSGGDSNGYGAYIIPYMQAYATGQGTIFESVYTADEIALFDANGAVDSIVVREVVNNEFMFLYGKPSVNSTSIFPSYPTYSVQPTIFTSQFANYEPLMYNPNYETHGKNEIIAGGFGREAVNTFSHGTGGIVRANSIGREVGSLYFDLENGGFGYRANSLTFVYNSVYDTTGNGASFTVGVISNAVSVQYNTDLICDRIIGPGDLRIDALQYNFPKNPTANLSSSLLNVFSYSNDTFGTIADIDNIVSGQGYTENANTFTRSTFTSNPMPGSVHFSASNSAIYGLYVYGVTRNYSNTDVIRIVNPNKKGTNAFARPITDSNGSILDAIITEPGRNFTTVIAKSGIFVSNSTGGSSTGTGGTFKTINQPYVTGTNTIFNSLFTNNEILYIADKPQPTKTDSIVVRQVVNNQFMWLYGYPAFESSVTSVYSVQPTVFTSQFANYEPLMYNTNYETHGKNEVILTDWKGDANSVLDTAHVDSGRGYWAEETVKGYLYGAISNNIVILNGGRGYQNGASLYFSGADFLKPAYGYVTTDANGTIIDTTLLEQGAGYNILPTPFVKVSNSVTEVATLEASLIPYNTRSSIGGKVVLRGYGIGRGYWLNSQGQLDTNKYIQDSYYYQDYSYELQVQKTLDQYKDIFYNSFHPAGSQLFGKYLETIEENQTFNIVVESTDADINPIGAAYRFSSTIITNDSTVITFDRTR